MIQEREYQSKIVGLFQSRDVNGLAEMENKLITDKMELDSYYSHFLRNQHWYSMSPEVTETPLWDQYRSKLKEYTSVQKLIKICSYYRRTLGV